MLQVRGVPFFSCIPLSLVGGWSQGSDALTAPGDKKIGSASRQWWQIDEVEEEFEWSRGRWAYLDEMYRSQTC